MNEYEAGTIAAGDYAATLETPEEYMASVPDTVVSVLAPYVGPMAADTCVRATALSIGKTRDTLGLADLPALEDNVRRLLGPVAPSDTIDRVLAEIERSATT